MPTNHSKILSHFRGVDTATSGYPSNSLLELAFDALQKNGETLALVDGQSGKCESYAGLLQKSTSIAAELSIRGVTEGNLVVICGNKSILECSLLLGIMFTGATTVLVPSPYAGIIHDFMKDHAVTAVFYDEELAQAATQSVSHISPPPSLVAAIDSEHPVMASLLNSTHQFTLHHIKDVSTHNPFILFTSGSTGVPKAIMTSHNAFMWRRFSDRRRNVIFTSIHLYYFSGIKCFLESLTTNNLFVFSNIMDAMTNLKLIQKHQVEVWVCVTLEMPQYIEEASQNLYDLSSLKVVYIGGEYLLKSVGEAFVTKVLKGHYKLTTAYGLTELGGLTQISFQQPGDIQLGAVGTVRSGNEVKILNERGQVVEIGSLGEIWVKSPQRMLSYLGKQELNNQLFDEEGFFRTEDAGFFDINGNLFLRGRLRDLIKYKGVKFAAGEIEELLTGHEGVLEVAVVGRPHASDEQHATAFVVRRPNCEVTQTQLEKFVNRQVDDTRQLRGGVHFLAALPRTSSNKIYRKELCEYHID